jgi:hypothetical protein
MDRLMNGFALAFRSLVSAAVSVRVWALCWVLVTVPALLQVWPLWGELKNALDHQPAATLTLNEHLDLDFARQHPELRMDLTGAGLMVMLVWTFLAGGILCRVGAGRFPAAGFFSDCGRCLPRNLRATFVGLLLLLLLNWGVDSLDAWLKGDVLADTDPGSFSSVAQARILTLESGLAALRWAYGVLFVVVVFAGKMARANLCVQGRRSALLAWLRAFLRMLRHPLRTLSVMLVLGAVWVGAGLVLGFAIDRADVNGHSWLLLVLSQVLAVVLQIVLIASLLAARDLMGALPVVAVTEADTAEVLQLAPVPEP